MSLFLKFEAFIVFIAVGLDGCLSSYECYCMLTKAEPAHTALEQPILLQKE